MEYEMIEAKVPKGFVRDGWQLVIGEKAQGDCVVSDLMKTMYGEHQWLILRPIGKNPLKPSEWRPPRLKKGWLTWDITCGWWWWSGRPYHTGKFEGWVHSESRCGDGGEQIGEVMAELLGCPDCSGFDERECIWEVG